jgi:Mitochondrial carrier protein
MYKEYFEGKVNLAFIYSTASLSAMILTLAVQYPFETIKVRLQSVNYIFKYQNLPHAFRKEVTQNGVRSLYSGAFPFLMTYSCYNMI